jgi:DNA repair protein RadD
MPQVETFKIDHITFASYTKVGSKPSLRVTYYCNLRHFNEFVCFEHDNKYTARKARLWWAERSELPLPTLTEDALAVSDKLKPPTHLRVWVNKKYPEILGTCFDGTAFGATEAPVRLDQPTIDVRGRLEESPNPGKPGAGEFDDDIPF